MITRVVNGYNAYNSYILRLQELFKSYLLSCGKTYITVKNYLSDIRHFLGWFYSQDGNNSDPETLFKKITKQTLLRYRLYLTEANIPATTTNRRLTTLRIFFHTLHKKGELKEDLSLGISNVAIEKNTKPQNLSDLKDQIDSLISEFRLEMDEKEPNKDQITSDIIDFFSAINAADKY